MQVSQNGQHGNNGISAGNAVTSSELDKHFKTPAQFHAAREHDVLFSPLALKLAEQRGLMQ